jgi:hypothetical protein
VTDPASSYQILDSKNHATVRVLHNFKRATGAAAPQHNPKNVRRFLVFFESAHAVNDVCLKTLGVTSRRLQDLAPLPTVKTESAGLCAMTPASIVSLPLPISGRV